MLGSLINKTDGIQEQIGTVSGVIESPRKNQKEMLDIKTLREVKNALDGLIGTLDIAEKKVCELEHRSTETFQSEM